MQAALKLVLEPIFEADFQPCSYGFRPKRRAQDAIAEIHQFTSRSYEWVLEGDIEACFDKIDHTGPDGPGAPTGRGQTRPGAGEGVPARPGSSARTASMRNTTTGTPQGGSATRSRT